MQDGTKQFVDRFPRLGAQWIHTVKYPESLTPHKPQDHVLCTETRWVADNDDFATLLQKCEELKKKIDGGEDFAAVAKEHSTCPSAKRGGDLGTFSPGQMVKPFDTVVFNEEVGKVHGPVKTQFGYHLILVKERK